MAKLRSPDWKNFRAPDVRAIDLADTIQKTDCLLLNPKMNLASIWHPSEQHSDFDHILDKFHCGIWN